MTKLFQQHPDWAKPYYRRLLLWTFGRRCELWRPGTKDPCGKRASGKYGLAQEFGTVQADLCPSCLALKLRQIAESEWGQYEARDRAPIRGDRRHPAASSTWKTTLASYRPSWFGRVLMTCRLDG